ncbi:transferases [Striga asiatica]|uniref:Transferases n=1 Tax=Striga asiatica TaxID=4170 RepID=A0A5A7R426_STRAF|nr:transferases [Striga asiatica]
MEKKKNFSTEWMKEDLILLSKRIIITTKRIIVQSSQSLRRASYGSLATKDHSINSERRIDSRNGGRWLELKQTCVGFPVKLRLFLKFGEISCFLLKILPPSSLIHCRQRTSMPVSLSLPAREPGSSASTHDRSHGLCSKQTRPARADPSPHSWTTRDDRGQHETRARRRDRTRTPSALFDYPFELLACFSLRTICVLGMKLFQLSKPLYNLELFYGNPVGNNTLVCLGAVHEALSVPEAMKDLPPSRTYDFHRSVVLGSVEACFFSRVFLKTALLFRKEMFQMFLKILAPIGPSNK